MAIRQPWSRSRGGLGPCARRTPLFSAAGLAVLVFGVTAYEAALRTDDQPDLAPAPLTLAGHGEAAGTAPRLGFSLVALTPEVRRRYGVQGARDGVLVTGVRRDSAAADSGIRPGDVIVSVRGAPAEAPADVTGSVQAAASADRRQVRLRVDRNGEVDAVALRVSVE